MHRIGSYTIEKLETGTFALDGGAMFGVVPKLLWNKKIPSDESNRIPLALRTLLIRGEGRIILVDAGIGDKWAPKMLDMFNIQQSKNALQVALQSKGIQPEDVTDLLLTHLHFDHVGGATFYDENRTLHPTLPNAKVHVQKSNYEHALTPNEKDRASYLIENFEPLHNAGLLSFTEGETEIAPGISVFPSNGHTIGQQLIRIGEGRETVVYCGDLVPTSAHLPIPWVMGYDLYPMQTIEEKKQLLPQVAKEGWTLFFEHDPVVSTATIHWTDSGPQIAETNVLREE